MKSPKEEIAIGDFNLLLRPHCVFLFQSFGIQVLHITALTNLSEEKLKNPKKIIQPMKDTKSKSLISKGHIKSGVIDLEIDETVQALVSSALISEYSELIVEFKSLMQRVLTIIEGRSDELTELAEIFKGGIALREFADQFFSGRKWMRLDRICIGHNLTWSQWFEDNEAMIAAELDLREHMIEIDAEVYGTTLLGLCLIRSLNEI